MPTEDFTTYTETDPNGDITIDANTISYSTLNEDVSSYVYYDKGVDFFDGNFEHLVDTQMQSLTGTDFQAITWILANNVDTWLNLLNVAGRSSLSARNYYHGADRDLTLYESDSGTYYSDSTTGVFNPAYNTTYYHKIKRDEAVPSSPGTIYDYIYSDSARTNLLDTLSVALHGAAKDYRYIYGLNTYNSGGTDTATGWVENLDLQIAVAAVAKKYLLTTLGVGA